MTLEEIIKQIEAEKVQNPKSTEDRYFNTGIDTALDILRIQPVIKAKALRDKFTKEWMTYHSSTGWFICEKPDISSADYTLPEDAELIKIEILIK